MLALFVLGSVLTSPQQVQYGAVDNQLNSVHHRNVQTEPGDWMYSIFSLQYLGGLFYAFLSSFKMYGEHPNVGMFYIQHLCI